MQRSDVDAGARGESHDHGESFPRLLTGELVGRVERGREQQRTWQTAALALAFALFALSLPTARLFGPGPELLGVGAGFSAHFLYLPLVHAFQFFGLLEIERAAFLLSALCAALSLPVLDACARRLGLEGGLRTMSVLILAATPVLWNAATSPGPAAAGFLGSCLLLLALLEAPSGGAAAEKGGSIAAGRWASVWLLACGLHLANVWLLFAVLWSARTRTRSRTAGTPSATGTWILLAAAPLGLAALLWWTSARAGAHASPGALLGDCWRAAALGTVDLAPRASLAALGTAVSALGLALIPIAVLFRRPGAEQSPAPGFWIPFFSVPFVVQISTAHEPSDLPFLSLLPMALLGLVALFTRCAERRAWELAGGLALLQLIVALAAVSAFRSADPHGSWRARAERGLREGDLVLTTSDEHAYLLEHRYALAVRDLNAALRVPPEFLADWREELGTELRDRVEGGGRIVLDPPAPGPFYDAWASEIERLQPNFELHVLP